MRPTYANLVRAKNGTLTVNTNLLRPKAGSKGLGSSRCQAKLWYPSMTTGVGNLSLESAQGVPPGMWVHYLETRANYGIAEGGETWAASGPFSGCQIVVGKKDGRIYVAHIAQQSGSTADKDWAARGWKDEVWARWKVSRPDLEGYYTSSIVFVDWSAGTTPRDISVVRMDIVTGVAGQNEGMGSFVNKPMRIFEVKDLTSS
jgi:hypothetical protein